MYNSNVLVEAWRGGTVYDAYIGASEEVDLAAAQVKIHQLHCFRTTANHL